MSLSRVKGATRLGNWGRGYIQQALPANFSGDVYEECDLHVGFRVHGHVSALKRRKLSYLLEQDGRGVDYGLSLSRRLTVPAVPVADPSFRLNASLLKSVLRGRHRISIPKGVPAGAVDQVLSLLDRDREQRFSAFLGLEEELSAFTAALNESAGKIVVAAKARISS